jgi:hypothetical protein
MAPQIFEYIHYDNSAATWIFGVRALAGPSCMEDIPLVLMRTKIFCSACATKQLTCYLLFGKLCLKEKRKEFSVNCQREIIMVGIM